MEMKGSQQVSYGALWPEWRKGDCLLGRCCPEVIVSTEQETRWDGKSGWGLATSPQSVLLSSDKLLSSALWKVVTVETPDVFPLDLCQGMVLRKV